MASVKGMENYGFSLNNIKTISEQDFDNLKKSDCSPKLGDILIAKDGSYLKHVFVWNSDIEIVILSSIAILRPHINVSSNYLALTLKQDSTKSMMSCYVSGAALPRIILDDFKKMKILMPDQTLLSKFDIVIQPIFGQIKTLIEKNEVLNNTRNLLLPRLISGKLTIKQAEVVIP
jgi:type I restriction enzyme, S subunit